jgi:hypothetical protein
MEILKFTTAVKTYTQAGTIERDDNTLGYHFINTGSVLLWLNNIPLYPSGVLDTMYPLCQDFSKYQLRFDLSAGTNYELTVINFNLAV